MEEEVAEKMCRYCFEGEDDGELISPCKCSGGQKYVHLKCLRQWQRMVLVTQPTHPAFYDRDLRHHTCNVCKAEFTCAPPTRHELMASFTGPEIAALIGERSIIAAHEAFSSELERQLEGISPFERHQRGYDHWIRGVFLITGVEEDEGRELVPVESSGMLHLYRHRIAPDLSITQQGRRFKLAASHSLEGVAPEDLPQAFAKLAAPCTLCFVSDEQASCGHDRIAAVNLARPLGTPLRREKVDGAVSAACATYRGAARVQLEHYCGGPCDEGDLVCCIVLGGGGCGWTVVKDLQEAIQLAHSRAVRRCEAQGAICGGQTVRLTGLQSAPELNGEIGVALRFAEASGRWLVRLRNGEGKQLKPANLEGLDGAGGRVLCFWGDARWSRAQLLGEIARGDWGLCRANVGDLTTAPQERWRNTAGRLAFAPITEMSEAYMRQAQREMDVARVTVQMHTQEAADAERQVQE